MYKTSKPKQTFVFLRLLNLSHRFSKISHTLSVSYSFFLICPIRIFNCLDGLGTTKCMDLSLSLCCVCVCENSTENCLNLMPFFFFSLLWTGGGSGGCLWYVGVFFFFFFCFAVDVFIIIILMSFMYYFNQIAKNIDPLMLDVKR